MSQQDSNNLEDYEEDNGDDIFEDEDFEDEVFDDEDYDEDYDDDEINIEDSEYPDDYDEGDINLEGFPTDLSERGNEALSEFNITKDQYTIKYDGAVPIGKIVMSEPVKKGRMMTIRGLTKSVRELGVVTPIHVMRLQTVDPNDPDADEIPEYSLLKGARRIFASVRNDLKTIPCIIWDFADKDKGRESALVLGLTLGRSQKRSWSEIWDLLNILEMQSQIKPATFESLFQLEGGDAMKLKDVMFSEYNEIKDELLSDEKTLEQCYKQLQKLRKEEDRLEIEDKIGFTDTSIEAKDLLEDQEQSENVQLSNEEVMELLEMGESFGKDVGHDDFSEMEGMFNEPNVQDVKNRKPLDPLIRQRVLGRDEYSCKCCGTHGLFFVGTLVVHHIIPVHAGGHDGEENLVTLCDSCHISLHLVEKNGKLPITEKQFNEYEYDDQLRIKNILHYARIAIVAGKRKGLTDSEKKKFASKSMRHRMPGEGYQENLSGYEVFSKTMEELDKAKQTV